MTLERPSSPDRPFVRAFLPWVVALAALAVYGATLNRWVNLTSLLPTARLSGWLWQPEVSAPVSWLATLPLRWLPTRLIPIAANLFSAVCAVLTLALLARSVALLPHDRTYEQRQRQKGATSWLTIRAAWLPPVFAVVVCGLQLTFWENATAAGTEILDVLIFAYVIRCLLEFRVDQRESWLARGAFVCGLGMTNDWALIGFFPLFPAALIWLMGLGFFNVRFLVRMFLWGLAGLSLYLLLPLAQHSTVAMPLPFWSALKANLAGEQYVLRDFLSFLSRGKQVALLLALTSLVPVLVISIRWASYFGDTSRLGILLTTMIFHLVHGLFLLVLLWSALDPPFSARNVGLSGLTLTYLAALSIGYFSGYFLLLFGTQADESKRLPPATRFMNFAISAAIWVLFAMMPILLVYRNLPQIRMTNGPMVRQFTTALAEGLPSKAVVLSDDARLYLLEAAAAQAGTSDNYLFIDTSSLMSPDYHRYLKKKYPHSWPSNPPRERKQPFEPASLMNLVSSLADSNSVYYAHPSFGYYFEMFYLIPHGLVYQLAAYPDNALLIPPLSEAAIADNERFWTKAESTLIQPLIAAIRPPSQSGKPSLLERALQEARLKWQPTREVGVLAGFYTRALDDWAVTLEDHGRWKEAVPRLQAALDLRPENLVARINLECNQKFQAGKKTAVENSKPITDLFGDRYRGWDQVMGDNGPFFEPTFCYAQGMQYVVGSGLYRQAATQMHRVRVLSPANFDARLWLAQLYVYGHQPEAALKQLQEIHDGTGGVALNRTNSIGLLSVETSAHLAANDLSGAAAAVEAAMTKFPDDTNLLAAAASAYINKGRFTNAIELLDRLLKLAPNNPSLLFQKGYVSMQVEAFDRAIESFDRVLAIQTNSYPSLLNRAISNLRSDKLEAAQRDYAALQKLNPTDFMLYFGLGEIAYRKNDTNAAVRNYELYLANNSRTNSPEFRLVKTRLKELKPASH